MAYSIDLLMRGGSQARAQLEALKASLQGTARVAQRVSVNARGATVTGIQRDPWSWNRGSKGGSGRFGGGAANTAGPGGGSRLSRLGSAVGGSGGTILSRFGGGAGLGPVGVAAAVAALALRGVAAASDRAVRAASLEVETRHRLRDAIKDAISQADSGANSAAKGNAGALRILAATGGDARVAEANALADRFGADAVGGSAALAKAGIFGQYSNRIAELAAGTGRMTFGEAQELLAKNKHLAFGAGTGYDAASALLGKAGHGVSADQVRAAARTLPTNTQRRLGALDAAEGQLQTAQLDRFFGGGTLGPLQEALAAAVNPEQVATNKHLQTLNDRVESLQAGSRAEWSIVELMRRGGRLVGGAGSASQQAQDEIDALKRGSAP